MKVYRIEREDGIGPYSSIGLLPYQQKIHDELNKVHLDKHHPVVYCDIPSEIATKFGSSRRCGFLSMSQLISWFKGYIYRLREVDYHITIYEVPPTEIIHGEYQLVFNRDKATLIRRY